MWALRIHRYASTYVRTHTARQNKSANERRRKNNTRARIQIRKLCGFFSVGANVLGELNWKKANNKLHVALHKNNNHRFGMRVYRIYDALYEFSIWAFARRCVRVWQIVDEFLRRRNEITKFSNSTKCWAFAIACVWERELCSRIRIVTHFCVCVLMLLSVLVCTISTFDSSPIKQLSAAAATHSQMFVWYLHIHTKRAT